jgi:hypothetical protein
VFDWAYYDRYYPVWSVSLPTEDMLEMAIPEGVLEPQGRISGFLYFPRVNPDAERVVFQAALVSARTGEEFGAVEVPFVVEE